jgi:hypothetical protein
MPLWGLQTAAVIVGLLVLGFFAFATAYYFRNRRIALAARERLNEEGGPAPTSADANGSESHGSPDKDQRRRGLHERS